MTQLLFDDEGAISRRRWWTGALLVIAFQLAAGWAAARWLGPRGLDRPLMLFVSLAVLIPVHALNAKRFRAIGRPAGLALWGGAVAGLAILAGAFLRLPALDIALGLAMIAVVLWYVVDLGVIDHEAHADAGRIDAAPNRS